MEGSVHVGDRAPDFTLADQGGQPVTASRLWSEHCLVLYFYPRDETIGCTVEACRFRDDYEAFKDAGAEVVGVSDDTVESHRGFIEHRRLPFPLLSDPGGQTRQRYGVGPLFGMLGGRRTFVIDRQGVVRHVFSSRLNWRGHVSRALGVVRKLSGAA